MAVEALRRIGPSAHEAVASLSRQLLNGDPNVGHFRMAQALGSIGTSSIPSLIAALKHRDRSVRRSAIAGLREVGPAAFPALAEVLRNGDVTARETAAEALAGVGVTAIPALTGAPAGRRECCSRQGG